MGNKRKFFSNHWTISLGTAIFSLLLTIIYDLVKSKPILSSVSQVFTWIFNIILSFLTLQIKVYWILLFIILVVIILYFLSKQDKGGLAQPEFLKYKTDKFKRFRWSWTWKFNHSQKAWNATDLTAHCPNCDTTMINTYSGIYGEIFECPRCNFIASGNNYEWKNKIETLILDNIRRKE